MQFIRHAMQVGICLLMVSLAYVNFYGVMIEQRNDELIQKSPALSFIHSFFKGKERSAVIQSTHVVKGSVWAFDIHGFKITDPLAFIESSTLTLSLYMPLFLSVLIPVILTLFFGRIFCGWMCPMHLILEINNKIRNVLAKIGYNVRDISFHRDTKYVILVVGLSIAFLVGMPLLSLFYPPAVISREIIYIVNRGWWGNGLLILGTICFIELILSKRWWCRSICPGGAVYCVLSKVKVLSITRNDGLCTECGACDSVCPYDLKPMTKDLKEECDQCRLCISSCPQKALSHTIAFPRNGKK